MKRLAVLILFLLGGGLFFYLISKPAAIPVTPISSVSTSTLPTPTSSLSNPPQKPLATQEPRIKIGSVNIPVELARTPAEVQKGLSGRLSLDQDKGMLFLFVKADIYSFWMPDMHFPLDMIWISSGKKVLGVAANVSNDFDPANPKFYKPPSPAQYVLEVNAGFASRLGIETGDNVTFMNIQDK